MGRVTLLDRWTLPAGAVRGLAVGAVLVAAALPWAATAVGAFERVAPVAPDRVASRPELIWLPGGTFQMGSPAGEVGRDSDEARHPVEVGPFGLCRTEVTQGQWEAVMGSRPSDCEYGCGSERPVQDVSWYDSLAYLNALSDREGLTRCYAGEGESVVWDQTCTGYRLPTEAEWEYAARAGTATAWSWGAEESGAEEHAWYSGNAGGKVQPVGTKAPNPWGLSDVHGNVWEWVWDGYGPYDVDTRVDKGGATEGSIKVLRGGSFVGVPVYLRSAVRFWFGPSLSHRDRGLRCARGPRPSVDPLQP